MKRYILNIIEDHVNALLEDIEDIRQALQDMFDTNKKEEY